MKKAAMLAGMGKAPMKAKTSYMEEGLFTVRTKVQKLVDGFDKQGKPRTTFISEFEILESSCPDKHKVGSTGSQAVVMGLPAALGDVKAFALAAGLGLDPAVCASEEQFADEHEAATALAMAAIDAEYAKENEIDPTELSNKVLKLETKKFPTKAGGEFTKYKWTPVAAEEQKQAA